MKGGRKHSFISLHNEELGRRNMSVGCKVELKDFEMVRDECGKKFFETPKMDLKKYKTKGKTIQVEDLKDMYMKNQFGIYVLDPRRCSSSY